MLSFPLELRKKIPNLQPLLYNTYSLQILSLLFFSNTCQIFDFVGSSMRIMDGIQDTAHSSVKSLKF